MCFAKRKSPCAPWYPRGPPGTPWVLQKNYWQRHVECYTDFYHLYSYFKDIIWHVFKLNALKCHMLEQGFIVRRFPIPFIFLSNQSKKPYYVYKLMTSIYTFYLFSRLVLLILYVLETLLKYRFVLLKATENSVHHTSHVLCSQLSHVANGTYLTVQREYFYHDRNF